MIEKIYYAEEFSVENLIRTSNVYKFITRDACCNFVNNDCLHRRILTQQMAYKLTCRFKSLEIGRTDMYKEGGTLLSRIDKNAKDYKESANASFRVSSDLLASKPSYISDKVQVMKELFIYSKITDADMLGLLNAKTEIQAEQQLHKLIMRYL